MVINSQHNNTDVASSLPIFLANHFSRYLPKNVYDLRLKVLGAEVKFEGGAAVAISLLTANGHEVKGHRGFSVHSGIHKKNGPRSLTLLEMCSVSTNGEQASTDIA